MNDYRLLIQAVQAVEGKIDLLFSYLQSTLTPLLYVLIFYILLKVGLTCVRGYKQ